MPATLTGRTLQKYLYLPDGWDDVWKAAKAASGSTPAQLALIGDSVMSGYASSNWQTKSWRMLLRQQLINLYGLAGDFWPIQQNALNEPALTGALPWTMNAPNYLSTPGGLAYGYARAYTWSAANFANPACTLDTSVVTGACTKVEVILTSNGNGGTSTWAIDNVNQTAITHPANNVMSKTSYSGLSAANHTLKLVAQSAGDYVAFVVGANAWANPSAGIFFAHHVQQGASIQDFASSTGHPIDRIKLQQGVTGAGDNTIGFGAPTQPHLGIIALGINDCTTHIGLDNYAGGLRRFVRAFRRGRANASVLFVANSNPDTVSSDVTTGFTDPWNYDDYVAAMRSVAHELNCGFVNIHSKWADQGVALGFQTATQAHPNDAGMNDMFTVIGSVT